MINCFYEGCAQLTSLEDNLGSTHPPPPLPVMLSNLCLSLFGIRFFTGSPWPTKPVFLLPRVHPCASSLSWLQTSPAPSRHDLPLCAALQLINQPPHYTHTNDRGRKKSPLLQTFIRRGECVCVCVSSRLVCQAMVTLILTVSWMRKN